MAESVRTGPPVVTLRNASARPYDGAIAAARTCYSPRVVTADEITPGQRDSIGPLTFAAGHHTVYQHAHFEFGLENVSRQFVWSFLHSHPFYNSEQSSQRFVRLDEISAFVPEGLEPAARQVYEEGIAAPWASYRTLSQILKEDTHRILSDLRHLGPNASEKRRKKVAREAEKKAIEVARYVIPVAAFTSMVHTVSGIVLHRLHRMMRTGDAPTESVRVVSAMVAKVREVDPGFFDRVDPSPDAAFYRPSRLVTHIDDHAIAAVGALYEELGIDGEVLDLMSSWVSHFNESPARLTVLGMNDDELAANAHAQARVVHDLNADPHLPFPDDTFDAVVCCVSVDYLVRPIEVFTDVARIVRSGGPFVCTFSNRCFPTKAIRGWLYSSDAQHAEIVSEYFRRAGAWTEPVVQQRTPAGHFGDPLWAVWAHRR